MSSESLTTTNPPVNDGIVTIREGVYLGHSDDFEIFQREKFDTVIKFCHSIDVTRIKYDPRKRDYTTGVLLRISEGEENILQHLFAMCCHVQRAMFEKQKTFLCLDETGLRSTPQCVSRCYMFIEALNMSLDGRGSYLYNNRISSAHQEQLRVWGYIIYSGEDSDSERKDPTRLGRICKGWEREWKNGRSWKGQVLPRARREDRRCNIL